MLKALREQRLGRYELLVELAHGGMAELFVALLRGAGGFEKLVAIKRILPHLARDKQFKEMFLNEGRIAANLMHPNVCTVFELDEVDDELFLAMEYLNGVTWDRLARELATGNFAMRLSVGVIAQACDGLHYAHTLRDVDGKPLDIVHRDVSPQNLFVTVDGICKVLDFGVSKMATDGPRTRSGVVKGKLPYMAPEQIRGEELDARADVFALGVCMWEALAGQRLFDRATDFMIWKAITEEPVPAVATVWAECPPALDAVVLRALAQKPEDRFATAREFADALRAACPLPPCGGLEIAEALKARCGDQLAERQREVATVVSARRAAFDPDAAATIEQAIAPSSMEIRQQSVTLDLRTEAKRAREIAEEEAAETRDLKRDARETRIVDDRPRSNLKTTILVAVIAAAVTAAVVVTVMMMNREERREPVAPVQPAPAINITVPAVVPPDAAEAVVVETPVDAAPVVVTTPKKKQPKTAAPPKSDGIDFIKKKRDPEADEPSTGVVDVDEIHKAADEARKAGDDLRDSMQQLKDQLQPK